jgi:hypothetical protein
MIIQLNSRQSCDSFFYGGGWSDEMANRNKDPATGGQLPVIR